MRLRSQKLELERALTKIGQLANIDDLTGLINRRRMTELMHEEQERQRRNPSRVTLAVLDIDWFKRFNDSLDHQAGDAVLQAFANISRQILRTNDLMARWGGEEFLLLLPSTTSEQAVVVIERVRDTLRRHDFPTVAPGLRVTFSAGIRACGPDDTLELYIERADQALYRAKSEGRDRTLVSDV